MKVLVNDTIHDVAVNARISDLLQQLNRTQTGGIAVAVNDMVVPKSQWNSFTLNENDKVLLIVATQGG